MSGRVENTPKLRFPEFSGEWVEEQLGDYVTFKNGVNADKTAYGSGYKFINVLDIIADGPITYDKIIGNVELSDSEFEKNEVIYGDILFQRSSETREEVGQSNVYLDRERSATFGGFVIRGRAKKANHPEFFDCLLKTSAVRSDMTARSGGSTRYNVGQESLSQVKIVVPSEPTEQQRIAAFLGAVDTKIGQLSRKKALLEDYKKGCMQQLFTQKLRFKDDHGNEFPDWEERLLGDLVKVTTGSSNREDSEEVGEYAFFDRSNDQRWSSKFLYDCEALIVAGEGKDFPPRYFNGKFDLHQRAYAITGFEKASAKFLFYWITWHRHHFLKFSVGSTMPSLRMAAFNKFPVSVPHPDEQQKVADFLSAIDVKISLVADELSAAQDFKKGLLQQMFV